MHGPDQQFRMGVIEVGFQPDRLVPAVNTDCSGIGVVAFAVSRIVTVPAALVPAARVIL